MKAVFFTAVFYCCFSGILIAQPPVKPTPYYKIDPLIQKWNSKKIKRVLVNYDKNEVVVFTRGAAVSITRQEAALAGITPTLPEPKSFQITAPVYCNVINIIEPGIYTRSIEKIISDDASVYFDENTSQLKMETNIPDTVTLFKVNTVTHDTIGICKKEVQVLPYSETQKPKVFFRNLNKVVVTKELLKAQTKIQFSEGYELVNATAYFAGPGFRNVVVASLNKNDLSPMQNIFDSCREGSQIVLDNIILKTPAGRLIRATCPVITVGSYYKTDGELNPRIQFGAVLSTTAENGFFKRQKKIYITGNIHCEFVGATVYFTGAGFPEVKSVQLKGNSTAPLQNYLEICRPGTVVVFDNVKVNSLDGIRTIDGVSFSLF